MRCPFAIWHPAGYDGGAYTSGPFRIVLHTTECSTAQGALDEFKVKPYASHFVVDDHAIYQLIDTGVAAKALQHTGSPETNHLSAVQIEMVGFAGKSKNPAMLTNVAKLCRWIESVHHVPQVWPNGFCVPAVNGNDSNHHNRNPAIWAAHSGYYGHEHVPENFHWDPALTLAEIKIITPAAFPAAAPAAAVAPATS